MGRVKGAGGAMTYQRDWETALCNMPLIAILRGVVPDQVEGIADCLCGEGFTILEVPLNSPSPFDSIAALAKSHGDRAIIGAGTVTTIDEAAQLRDAGGQLVVSPHCDPSLIRWCADAGLIVVPGAATPSEAISGLRAGASALKLFPAEAIPPAAMRAMSTILPSGTRLFPVGGITPERMLDYKGAAGFGIGSALFSPDRSMDELRERAIAFAGAWRMFEGGQE